MTLYEYTMSKQSDNTGDRRRIHEYAALPRSTPSTPSCPRPRTPGVAAQVEFESKV
jgi:hypothetical protein